MTLELLDIIKRYTAVRDALEQVVIDSEPLTRASARLSWRNVSDAYDLMEQAINSYVMEVEGE